MAPSSHFIEFIFKRGFLFPPIVQRSQIDFSEACCAMKQFIKAKDQKKKSTSIIQTYNAKDQLIMTPILK